MKKEEYIKNRPIFVSKMKKADLPPMVIDRFLYYYEKIISGETGMIYNHDIKPVAPDEIEDYRGLIRYTHAGERAFPFSVRIILNGGLGTSMGLTGPKTLLEVRNGLSFLNIILKQVELSGVTLALMNSFNTQDQTIHAINKMRPKISPLFFLQHKFPKIFKKDHGPAQWPKNNDLEWNPPGHGDVFSSLYSSGMLNSLLDQGIQYAFISNGDNLGATMDASLLGYFSENQFPFMMEVAEKTPSDIKGGHLARHKNGRLILRESAQCPENELSAFQDIQHFRYFNTNNIWINLLFLKNLLDKETFIKLPMIVNPKTVDPRDKKSPEVYQIESAMGAAISLFDQATAVVVPRSRFSPVKKCSDLLAVRSDCFVFSDAHKLFINPVRTINENPVKVALDPAYFGQIDQFDQRFNQGVPSLVDCKSITVEGDVRFEGNIKILGTVKIKNEKETQAVIKEGSVIEKDLIL